MQTEESSSIRYFQRADTKVPRYDKGNICHDILQANQHRQVYLRTAAPHGVTNPSEVIIKLQSLLGGIYGITERGLDNRKQENITGVVKPVCNGIPIVALWVEDPLGARGQ